MNSVIILNKRGKIILVDKLLLAFVYLIPTLSHLASYPLYYFEPMRVVLFTSILLLRDKRNAYFLAVTLPLFSFVVSGHPIAIKNIIMTIELTANVYFLNFLLNKNINNFFACLISIITSKLFYYSFKFIIIRAGFLSLPIIGTSFISQIIVAIFISIVFMLVYNLTEKKDGK